MRLGVPTYRDAREISRRLAVVLARLASPVLTEVRFAVYPIVRADAAVAERLLGALDWRGVACVLRQPQFGALKRVVFESGRAAEYAKVPGAFVPLHPALEKVMPEMLGELRRYGVEVVIECI